MTPDPLRRVRGFTLIELMVTVAIAAILASVAIPMYRDYVIRSRIIDATSKLSDFRVRMEQYFMDNRTYANGANCGIADPKDTDDASFTIACKDASARSIRSSTSSEGSLAKSSDGSAIAASSGASTNNASIFGK